MIQDVLTVVPVLVSFPGDFVHEVAFKSKSASHDRSVDQPAVALGTCFLADVPAIQSSTVPHDDLRKMDIGGDA